VSTSWPAPKPGRSASWLTSPSCAPPAPIRSCTSSPTTRSHRCCGSPATPRMPGGMSIRLTTRLPATLTALGCGQIDLYQARLLTDLTDPLQPAQAAAVEAQVLPRAAEQTPGQLRAAARRAVLRIDPEGAKQRRQERVRDRAVILDPREDGTAELAPPTAATSTTASPTPKAPPAPITCAASAATTTDSTTTAPGPSTTAKTAPSPGPHPPAATTPPNPNPSWYRQATTRLSNPPPTRHSNAKTNLPPMIQIRHNWLNRMTSHRSDSRQKDP
jgi:Domain of unknown function (DUF222)